MYAVIYHPDATFTEPPTSSRALKSIHPSFSARVGEEKAEKKTDGLAPHTRVKVKAWGIAENGIFR